MDQKCCLSEGFFQQMSTVYENCYRINPNPSEAFLERMHLIEIEARRLRDSLEELQIASYRFWEPERLTEVEKTMLKDYDRTAKIIKEFMPYLTAAFILSMPPLEIPDPLDGLDMLPLAPLNNLPEQHSPKHEKDYSDPLVELPQVELPSLNVADIQPQPILIPETVPTVTAARPDFCLQSLVGDNMATSYFTHGEDAQRSTGGRIMDRPQEKEREVLPVISTSLPEEHILDVPISSPVTVANACEIPVTVSSSILEQTEMPVALAFSSDLQESGIVAVAPEILAEEEFEQLVRDTSLTWRDVQSCYPDSSIVKFLQQVMGTAVIRFNRQYNPVLDIMSMKETYHYEYELNEYAFKHDLDSILNERVIEELHNLTDDLN